MLVRPFNIETDKIEVMSWWKSQGWPEQTVSLISTTGFVVEDDEKLAATWVIKTNSPIYLIEWTVGNPEVNWEKRRDALDMLTDYACDWAKDDGATATMIMTKNKRYIDKLKNNGFIESDENMIHLIRGL